MISRRMAVTGLAIVAVGAGSAGAIAATGKKSTSSANDPKQTEQAILDDAAKRLNVTPEALRNALSAAQDAQLDQAVKDGKLTQEQANRIKEFRKQSGHVLGGPALIGPGGPRIHFEGPGHKGGLLKGGLEGAAKALGLSEADLMKQLRSGKTLAAIAKAQGKELADVKAAVKSSLTTRLDAAVKSGKLSAAQRDEILKGFDEHFDRFASEGFRGFHERGRFRGGPDDHPIPGPPPPPPGGGYGYGPPGGP